MGQLIKFRSFSQQMLEATQQRAQEAEKQCAKAEEALKRRTRELSLLLDVLQHMPKIAETEALVSSILETLQKIIHYSRAVFFLLEEEDIHVLGYHGPLDGEAHAVRSLHFPLEQLFPYQELLHNSKTRIIDDLQATSFPTCPSSCSMMHEYLTHLLSSSRSLLAVPLVVEEEVMGQLLLTSDTPHFYTPHDTDIALALTAQCAIAVQHARHVRQKQHRAIIEERQRLACELHDSLSQGLYGIGLGAHAAREELEHDPQQAIAPIEYVISLAEISLAEMRSLILDLQPDVLHGEGLLAALHKYILVLQNRYKLTVQADLAKEPEITLTAKQALFRITQEACFNTIKHAQASMITLRLRSEEQWTTLEICDDGIGFDTHRTFAGHLGCISMKKRIDDLGGIFSIKSSAERGTCITVSLPD